jgi:hypothetical protein
MMKARIAIVFLLVVPAMATLNGIGRTASSAPTAATAIGQTFGTVEEAVAGLVDALRSNQASALERVLGSGTGRLVQSGDQYSDAEERRRFLDAYNERHEIVVAQPGRAVLKVGKQDWPLPIPLVQTNGLWHFDGEAGAQELVHRRIGRNEIAAIRTALAYVDAQKVFFALTGQNGQAEYAQHLVSSPGKHDGLYWPAAEGEAESPLAPLVAEAEEAGYPGAQGAGRPIPYHGYLFRILTGQGTNSAEGAINYVSDGRMTKGFALISWPASYGASGIMSFVADQDGIVFQKDLGPHTASIAAATKLFDPDLSWTRVDISD